MACILPEYTNKFIDGLKNGEIDPKKLSDMTSDERRDFLAKYVGPENAKNVNTQFEGKLLLKNQKAGMISWAKSVAGLNEKAKNDIIAKVDKLEKALTPEEQDKFLGDIVEKRLGVQVTPDEAKTIVDITSKMKEAYPTRFTDPERKYGQYKQQLSEFMREHSPKREANLASETMSFFRAVKTGFDLSASLRQGASYFGTKEWNGAFQRMFDYAKSKSNLDSLESEMYTHKYSDQAIEVKKDLGLTMLGESFTQREEAFASRIISKVPFLKGSERAFEGFLNDIRFHRFVNILDQLDKSGNSISSNKPAMKELARVIAASTGRGELGSLELAAKPLATALFAPRWIASRLQILTNPILKRGIAQKEAAVNLARLVGVSASVLGLAKMAGAQVETDSRSSDFGKVKVGDSRFDITGGLAPYVVLMSRLAMQSVKSSTSHKVTGINTQEFNSKTGLDLLLGFIEGKTSPVGSIIRDVLKGESFDGQKIDLKHPSPALLSYLSNSLIVPMLATDTIDAYKQASGDNKIGMGAAAFGASLLGVGVSTYGNQPQTKDWENLKQQKGDQVYGEATKSFQNKFESQLKSLESSPKFKQSNEAEQSKMIDDLKHGISKHTLSEFGYVKPHKEHK